MNQEENKENSNPSESGIEVPGENLNPEELAARVEKEANAQEIDNLPIESIGSYARLEELLTDEEADETSNLTAQS